MDDNLNELEAGTLTNIPRHLNKKMRKRKHLDALLKSRSTKPNSNDILRSSEDELFLPYQKPSVIKSRSSSYRRCLNYSKHFLSFTLVCIFTITCIGLTYANIGLKNEVQNLSLRINEIEQKFSNMELNNISSTIKQIITRLHVLEQLNFSLRNDSAKLDKSAQSSEIPKELDVENRFEKMINERMMEWDNQLTSLRNQIQTFNQTTEMQTSLEQFKNLLHNSSDRTSVILTKFQSDLDKLQSKIDQCKCSEESIHLKPSVVDSDQLQQSIVTKPNIISSSGIKPSSKVNNDSKQTANITDVEQIVNRPSVPG